MAQQSEAERESLREYVERWKWLGPVLEEIRRREIESSDTQASIRRLFPETRFSHLPKRTTSGLIEQQVWFAKLRQ